jgi:hypothetical protein
MVKVVQPKVDETAGEAIVKRGQKMWTDSTGAIVEKRVLSEDEVNSVDERPAPEYIMFHEQVLGGANPIDLQKEYEAGKPLDVPNEPVAPVVASADTDGNRDAS